jgi:hypothetical protein
MTYPHYKVLAWATPKGVVRVGDGWEPRTFDELYRCAPPAAHYAILCCDRDMQLVPPINWMVVGDYDPNAAVVTIFVQHGRVAVADIYGSSIQNGIPAIKPKFVMVDFRDYEHAVAYLTISYVHDAHMEMRAQHIREEVERRYQQAYDDAWNKYAT